MRWNIINYNSTCCYHRLISYLYTFCNHSITSNPDMISNNYWSYWILSTNTMTIRVCDGNTI